MTVRKDILAISEEALESLTNRGTLRRAKKEVDGEKVTCQWNGKEDGTIIAVWSDGATCTIEPETSLGDADCTCPASSVCRHLVRTVLAYSSKVGHREEAPTGPWNPGDITDEQLASVYAKRVITAAKKEFEEGLLVEVVRSEKPFAVIHGLGVTIRFPVQGDVRYAQADTSGQTAEKATINAVKAFRLLPAESNAGYVVTGKGDKRAPADIVDDGESLVTEIIQFGFAGASTHLPRLLSSLEDRCRSANLVWPAEILSDLSEETKRYNSHDSLFSPENCVELLAEWLVRSDALSSLTGTVPSLLISGTRHDVPQALSRRRLVGLGCAPTVRKNGVVLRAYLQDQESGALTFLERRFKDPEDSEPKSFTHLANAPVVKGASLKDLATYHILIGSGKRSPSGRLIPGRKVAASPQTYEWENLREPLRVENLIELKNRLSCLPPTPLRPRNERTNFHVIPVSTVTDIHFDSVHQTAVATFTDKEGAEFFLCHPYISRGAQGFEKLLQTLSRTDIAIKFVAGTVNLQPRGITIEPTAIVFEEDGVRSAIQPWLQAKELSNSDEIKRKHQSSVATSPLRRWFICVNDALAELLIMGLVRSDQTIVSHWAQITKEAESLGLGKLSDLAGRIHLQLENHLHQRDKSYDDVLAATKELSVAVLIGAELI